MALINPLSLLKKSRYQKKVGSSPGQYIYLGDKTHKAKITLIKYGSDSEESVDIHDFDHLKASIDTDKVNWINLDGVGDVDLMKAISEHFQFNPLMTEDIMNTDHLPKSEEYDKQLFITLKMIRLDKNNDKVQLVTEHVSLVLGPYYVISFQDNVDGDVFSPVRQRISSGKGNLRKRKSDYLFYALIDTLIDQFFLVMEYIREQIDDLEEFVLNNPVENIIKEISRLRRKVADLRRTIYMMHEAIRHLATEESDFIDELTNPYLKDVLDHTTHLTSSFDSFRDFISNIMDMSMSNMSNNLNIVMKTLTIFSLFFVPLTFIAGIYGMNFAYMPELGLAWGYPAVITLMILITFVMYIYMKRKKWF